MSVNFPIPHHGSVSEYQVSGVPYVTTLTVSGTAVSELKLPYVTRHFTLLHSGTTVVRAGFTQNGVNSNPDPNFMLVLPNTSTPRFEIKCNKLFFVNDSPSINRVTVVAGLTNVTENMFFNVTGSNGVSGVG